MVPPPKTEPRKLVFRGSVGTLIQVRKTSESDEGFHPQIGEQEGPCEGNKGGERGTEVQFQLTLTFDDLLTMSKLLDLAHTWIMHQQQADAKGRKESAQAAA